MKLEGTLPVPRLTATIVPRTTRGRDFARVVVHGERGWRLNVASAERRRPRPSCGRCGEHGHNVQTCKAPIADGDA